MADLAPTYSPLLIGDRPLPQSLDAERAVLSCILQDAGSTLDTVLARLRLDECFYQPAHRRLLGCIREMRTRTMAARIDLITVSDALERQGALEEIGGLPYLNELLGVAPTTANLDKYLECVLDAYLLRRLIDTSSRIAGRCFEADEQIDALIDSVEQEILSITEMRTETTVKSIRELIPDAINFLEQLSKNDPSAMGLQTGFLDLDRLVGGLKPGELVVLAARPSIGKTTLVMNIARNVAVESKKAVGVFSLEMSSAQVVVRLLCSEARIDAKDLREGRLSNEQWRGELMPAADRLYSSPLLIDDTAQISALELRQKARRMKQEHDIALIVIDYLQLMRPTGGNKTTNREQEVARLSSDIKSLAKELKIPILLLCQLNRQAEQGGGKPKLSHLRESGAIEQDADMVFLLHRERETEAGITREEVLRKGIESELIVAKNRNGETGIVRLVFLPHFTRFENATRFGADDVPGDI
jgi:replicative DNA helicase